MRRALGFVLLLAVLAGLLVGAEFVVRDQVRRQAITALTNSVLQAERPTLEIASTPVLWELPQGRFPDVSGTADSAVTTLEGHEVTVRGVRYAGSRIRLADDTVTVGRLQVDGRLDFSALGTITGLPIEHGGGDRLLVSYRVEVPMLGAMVIGVSGVPVLERPSQQVRIERARIEVSGVQFTPELSQQLIDRVVKPLPLRPESGWEVTSIAVGPDGLLVGLLAGDLKLKRG